MTTTRSGESICTGTVSRGGNSLRSKLLVFRSGAAQNLLVSAPRLASGLVSDSAVTVFL